MILPTGKYYQKIFTNMSKGVDSDGLIRCVHINMCEWVLMKKSLIK